MINKNLKINERLVVSLDFKLESDLDDIKSKILNFCDEISDTGVYIKLNSSLIISSILEAKIKSFSERPFIA